MEGVHPGRHPQGSGGRFRPLPAAPLSLQGGCGEAGTPPGVGGALACRGRRAASQGASARPVGEAGEPTRGQAAHTPDAAQALAGKLDWRGGRPAPPSRSGEAAGCHGRLSLVTKCSRHFPRCVSPAPIAEGVTGPGSLPHCREHPLCPCTDLRPAHCWPEASLTGIFVTAEILLKEDKALKKKKKTPQGPSTVNTGVS